jgi:flagellar hook-basal body complex protein FliE
MPVESIGAAAEAIGGEWQGLDLEGVGGAGGPGGAGGAGGVEQARPAQPEGEGFGSMLAQQVGNLSDLQTDAARQAQALATGQAQDVSSVVMAVERAQLSMQLASQLRNKAVEAYQEIFRTQV